MSVQPDGVAELVYNGREVVVQAGAGSGLWLSTTSTSRHRVLGAAVPGACCCRT